MDVEGPHAKLNVLKGAQGTLRHKRHLLIEFDADDYRQIWDRMADAGFEGGFVSWSKHQAVQGMFFSRDVDLMARLRRQLPPRHGHLRAVEPACGDRPRRVRQRFARLLDGGERATEGARLPGRV